MNRFACALSLLGFCALASSAQTIHPEATLNSPVPIEHATACDNGAQLVGLGKDGALYLWTLPSAEPRKIALPEGKPDRFACGTGKTFLLAFPGGKVLLLDSATGEVRGRLDAQHDIQGLALSPDGLFVATGTNRTPTQLWDARSGKLIFTTATIMGGSRAVAFSPGGELIVSLDEDAFIRGYDRQGKMLFITHDGLLQPYNVMFTRDGKQFAVTGAAGDISLFDSSSGKHLNASAVTGHPMFESTISPDSKRILAIGIDDFTMDNSLLALWDMHSEAVTPLAFESKSLIGLGANKTNLLLIKKESPQKLALYSIQ